MVSLLVWDICLEILVGCLRRIFVINMPKSGDHNYLERISALLMICRFGTGYEIDNGLLGHYYVMDDEDHAEFKKYFWRSYINIIR